jgi:hypothetical protein
MPEIWKNVDKRTIADSLIEILRTTWPCSRLCVKVEPGNSPRFDAEPVVYRDPQMLLAANVAFRRLH